MNNFDEASLEELFKMGSFSLVDQLAQYYFDHYKEFQNIFRNSLSCKEFRAIARLAHQLKSTASQLGLRRLQVQCNYLEHKYHNQIPYDQEDILLTLQIIESGHSDLKEYLLDFQKKIAKSNLKVVG